MAERDIGLEILEGIQEIKAYKAGKIDLVDSSGRSVIIEKAGWQHFCKGRTRGCPLSNNWPQHSCHKLTMYQRLRSNPTEKNGRYR